MSAPAQITTDPVLDDAGTAEEAPAPAGLFTRFAAEFLGTFLVIFIGFGVVLYAGITVNPDEGLRLLSWGAAVALAVALFHRISGGHFNPAVTLAAAITGHSSWRDVLVYWVGQLLGAAAAAGLLFLTIPKALPAAVGKADTHAMFSANASGFGEHSVIGRASNGSVSSEMIQVLLIETIAAALFVGIALMAMRWRDGNRISTAVVTGLSYGALTVATYSLTGGALNPARATAGAVFAEDWALGQLWLFWVAPIVGGAIAGLLITVFSPEPIVVDELAEEDGDHYEEYDQVDADGHRVTVSEEPADLADLSAPAAQGESPADADDADSAESDDEDGEADSPAPQDPADTPARSDSFTEDYDVTRDDDSDEGSEDESGEGPADEDTPGNGKSSS